MSVKSIQISVSRHANEIFGENIVKKADKVESDSYDETSYAKDGLTATINIHEKYAAKFNIVTKEGSDRRYPSLGNGWTDALHEIIVDNTNTHCVFQFERGNIINGELEAAAKCSECHGTLTVKSIDNRTKVIIEIVHGAGQHSYTKRRRLTVTRAKSLIPALQSDCLYNVHSDLVNELDSEIFTAFLCFGRSIIKYKKSLHQQKQQIVT